MVGGVGDDEDCEKKCGKNTQDVGGVVMVLMMMMLGGGSRRSLVCVLARQGLLLWLSPLLFSPQLSTALIVLQIQKKVWEEAQDYFSVQQPR